MKYIITIVIVLISLYSCDSTKSTVGGSTADTNEPVRIANDSLEYEIIIYDSGFRTYLRRQNPSSSYNLNYLETKNYQFAAEYNRRVYNSGYSQQLYPNPINYERNVDYGMEVNYLLYNYFIFFQEKFNQKL